MWTYNTLVNNSTSNLVSKFHFIQLPHGFLSSVSFSTFLFKILDSLSDPELWFCPVLFYFITTSLIISCALVTINTEDFSLTPGYWATINFTCFHQPSLMHLWGLIINISIQFHFHTTVQFPLPALRVLLLKQFIYNNCW